MRVRRALFLAVAALLCAGAVYAAFQAAQPAPAPLSAFVPQGSLLAIESPDFAALLHRWTDSAEQKLWLASDNYAGFARSRLFGRLTDAQSEFAATAGLPPNAQFLQQAAGAQSLLAWYDIGNLEFLYITRMPSGQAENSPLFKLRDRFQERKVGDVTFYVRTDQNTSRTVAFAVRGDYLLLATREDLLAGALDMMQHPTDRSLKNESWYASTVAAAAGPPGDLRMTLNLARIVPSPYFRSYWIQQNITEMKQYTAALSDLYREKNDFREVRVLLPRSADHLPASADLSSVLAYLPADQGIYRAQAEPSTAEVLAELDDKLLTRQPSSYRDLHIAPVADLGAEQAGSESDLEQPIDEPLPVVETRSSQLQPLADAISAAQPSAMMVFSTAAGQHEPVFLPIHSAVVLAAQQEWNRTALEQGITAALSRIISVSGEGLAWTAQHNGDASWAELDGLKGLSLAVAGKICIVATDRTTLLHLLQASQHGSHAAQVAVRAGGFNLGSEREPYLQLTRLLDRSGQPPQGSTPTFFPGNLGSLSDTFGDLDSETFFETEASGATRQTVVYQWH